MMKTKAVRIHGVQDLRLEEFDIPDLKEDEILARVVSDSICMSSHKLAMQGAKHKRVRQDLSREPVILGHEFCGVIEKVGAKWSGAFKPGARFAIQPALNYQGTLWAPGYSYPYIGGDATYIIIPAEVMEMNCLLEYTGDAYYLGSLAEPVSCILGAFHAQYHTKEGSSRHIMGIAEGGYLLLLAGTGPMGLGAIDYAIHNPRKPSRLVVTGRDDPRLDRARRLLTVEEARRNGVELIYVNTKDLKDPADYLKGVNQGRGYDDVFVFAPVKQVLELGDRLLGPDGCLNFFAGPTDPEFAASLNFYQVHYEAHHLVGTSGGTTEDMKESLELMAKGILNPVFMVTHIGGLNEVVPTTLTLDRIPGGKKLIYTHKNLELTAIEDFQEKGKTDPFYRKLGELCAQGLWNQEAEAYLLEYAPEI